MADKTILCNTLSIFEPLMIAGRDMVGKISRTATLWVGMLLLLVLITGATEAAPAAGTTEKLNYPAMASSFYNKKKVFWTAKGNTAASLREYFIQVIENSKYKGLDKSRYHTAMLHSFDKDSEADLTSRDAELYFTDAAITYCKDLIKAPEIDNWMSYDDVSSKYAKREDEALLKNLLDVDNAEDLKETISLLEPSGKKYKLLLTGMAQQVDEGNIENVKKLRAVLAYYRWIHHFRFDKFIVVNIAAAKLHYYENGTPKLTMKVVAGKSATETPRFAAYCNQITLYPYWHVPRSIAVNKILPFCQENVADIDSLNLQVLDRSGNIVKPSSVKWAAYSSKNFPYTFRQLSGCDNPLGLIKFNLTDPFDIYMHDTNVKPAFKAKKRFFSHGCIRLEDPAALANILLKDKLPDDYMANCLEDQKPKNKSIDPIPVFVIYMPAEATGPNGITVYDDIYGLL